MARIVIIGAGFAGVWSALSAKRLATLVNKESSLEIQVIAPEPSLVMRPRLYEANPSRMTHPLGPLFKEAGVSFLQGIVQSIDTKTNTIQARSIEGVESTVQYDRLILAAGSSVVRPRGITGIEQNAFDVDSLASAEKLDAHIQSLASLPESPSRDTIVVCGAGFTGIEAATELPKRLTHLRNTRVILVGNADHVGPDLGPPRPVITEALTELGVELRLGSAVTAIDSDGVTLASGEQIETKTVIWTAGVRATPLTQQIPSERDPLNRLRVDQHLRVSFVNNVFATGDAACALADTQGHYALMSCQHALQLGRVSGHNAAADLLGEPLTDYQQASYNCCLDLGAWGSVICAGWEKEVSLTGFEAKKVKCYINQKLIYPPAKWEQALTLANPVGPDSDELFRQIKEAIA
ncbi:hypothetical protein N7520_004079 [Penicillium odoratum]|uniref:uncharacterized protein n=1 Tax=Penicillium odoratum TaxID=1167516 RepID=UPI002546AA36|nr:uncharacterized protein N7520_004079 [Penicillium odoratum]KAJ5769520.1 hypothetical protein N7520_004079 [Penicillium odoratum]